MDPTRWLDAGVTWALELGPDGRFVLPVLGAVGGLFAVALAWILLAQRTAWRARELVRALRATVHATEEGERVVVLGRLRAPGGETIASFEREDRRAVVSSIHQRVGRGLDHVATRATPGLVLETREGPIPIAGHIDVRRTRATKKAKNVDAGSLARAVDPASLRAVDVTNGQWVLAEGLVARITREGLREQAGVRGLGGAERAPVVLTALRPEVPPWTFRLGALGALVACVLATPLPWPWAPSFVPVTDRAVWDVITTVRLLGPTREAALEHIVEGTPDAQVRAWRAVAQLERGHCDVAIALLHGMRRDEEAIALLDRPDCPLDPAIALQLLRESGEVLRAQAAAPRAALTDAQRAAIAAEAGAVIPAGTARLGNTSALACDGNCVTAISGAGDRAFDLVMARQPARGEAPVPCGHRETVTILQELGLDCSGFSPERGLEALRVAPRPRVVEPLSRIEARLHVHRWILDHAGEHEAARAVEARQRRLLAVLSTPGGAHAEALLSPIARVEVRGSGCMSPLHDPEEYEGPTPSPRFVSVPDGATAEERAEALLRDAPPSTTN